MENEGNRDDYNFDFKDDEEDEDDNADGFGQFPSGEWHPLETAELEEERNQKIREAFQILTQGVEIVEYEVPKKKGEVTKNKKIMWMDSDILRLCIDIQRPTIRDRSVKKIPYGIYMRDIAEVRKGIKAHGFEKCSSPPNVDDMEACLSLIGTEGAICIQLPTKFSRDWFAERFELVVLDVLTEEELDLRNKRRIPVVPIVSDGQSIASQMFHLLERGIQVLHHHPSGKVIQAYLSYDDKTERLSVVPAETSYFVKPLETISMSIIGSENTIDLQLATTKARDLFISKMRIWVGHQRPSDVVQTLDENNQYTLGVIVNLSPVVLLILQSKAAFKTSFTCVKTSFDHRPKLFQKVLIIRARKSIKPLTKEHFHDISFMMVSPVNLNNVNVNYFGFLPGR
eukprot:gene3296-6530_t